MNTDIIIIGGGPIGLFTVFQAGMLGMKCHIIDALDFVGGQCVALYPEKPIYDIPAYPQILAKELVDKLKEQSSPFNPVFHLSQSAMELVKTEDGFTVITSQNVEISSKVVIIAAGAGCFAPCRPPLVQINQFENKSVFYSVQKKEEFTNKKIIIAGGGDSAVDWAIELSNNAEKIYLVHRRDKFRALPENIKTLKELANLGKIELLTGYQLDSLDGKNGLLEKVTLKDFNNNKKDIRCDVLLPFFGLVQSLGSLKEWGLDINQQNIKVSQPYYETNIEGVYAIGDIANYEGKLKLILTGFAEAANCLHHAYSRVFNNKPLHFEYSTSKGVPLHGE